MFLKIPKLNFCVMFPTAYSHLLYPEEICVIPLYQHCILSETLRWPPQCLISTKLRGAPAHLFDQIMNREVLPLTTHTQQAWAKFLKGNSHSMQHHLALTLGQNLNLGIKAPVKTDSQTSTQTCQDTWKKPRLRPFLSPEKNTKIPNLQTLHGVPLLQTIRAWNMPQLQPIPQLPGHPSEWYLRDYMETTGAVTSWQIPPFLLLRSPLPILLSALPSKKSESLSHGPFECPLWGPSSILFSEEMARDIPHVSKYLFFSPMPPGVDSGSGRGHHEGSCFWRFLCCVDR